MIQQTIVITGAAGFIGCNSARHFALNGWSVIGIDRRNPVAGSEATSIFSTFQVDDLSSPTRLGETLRQHKPSALIHAAGPASVERSFVNPHQDFDAQVAPWLTVLDAVRQHAADIPVVLCSSAAVYGNPQTLPVKETATVAPISPYGYHKFIKELLLREYVELYCLKGTIARLFSTFGPAQRQLAVWDIARKVMTGEYRLQGTGRETRDYLYVDDVAAALERVVLYAKGNAEAINIASGTETEIGRLARMIALLLGKPDSIHFSSDETHTAGKPTRWRADVNALRSLGFSPQFSLEHGLRTTIEWIRSQ